MKERKAMSYKETIPVDYREPVEVTSDGVRVYDLCHLFNREELLQCLNCSY